MNYDSILKNVIKHIVLNQEEVDYFISLLRYKEVAKKDFLLRAGEIAKHLSFIHTGAFKAYHLDVKSNENIIMLAIDDWWITDMYSFSTGEPAVQFISAIEDSAVFQIQKTDFENLLVRVPSFERFFRILMQKAYVREQMRIIQNLSMPAEERYINFLKKYPKVSKRVLQKQIASYIGVSPEFLSSMRKRLGKKINS